MNRLAFLLFITVFLTNFFYAQSKICIVFDMSGSMLYELQPDPTDPTYNGICSDQLLPNTLGVHQPTTRYMLARNILKKISVSLLNELADVNHINQTANDVRLVRFPAVASSTAFGFPPYPLESNPFRVNTGSNNDIFDHLTNNITIECLYGTPLQSALQEANTLLNGTASTCTKTPGFATLGGQNKMIFLICDGKANDIFATDIDAGLGGSVCDNVEVHVIGIGNYAESDHMNILSEIAGKRNGSFYAWVATGGTLNVTSGWPAFNFSDFSRDALKSTNFDGLLNALEYAFFDTFMYNRVLDPFGILVPGQGKEIYFNATPLDTSLIFAFHSQSSGEVELSVSFKTPDGSNIDNKTRSLAKKYSIRKSDHLIYFFFYPNFMKNNYGEWQINLSSPKNNNDSLLYSYSIYARSNLIAETELANKLFETGDFLNGNTQVTFNSKHINNIKVQASYIQPGTWIGNWNAEQKLSEEELELLNKGLPQKKGKIEPWPEDTDLLDRKLIFLDRVKGNPFTDIVKNKRITKDVFDNGQNGDEQSGDGIYNRNLLELKTPGLYEVSYKITGELDDSVSFERALYFQKYVDVKVEGNWNDSKIEFKPLKGNFDGFKAARVSVLFRDRYKNVPLPGKAGIIEIVPKEPASPSGPLVDRLDGTYTQEILYDPALGKPIVSATYGDIVFPGRQVVFNPKWNVSLYSGILLLDNKLLFKNPLVLGFRANRYFSDRLAFQVSLEGGVAEDKFGKNGNILVTSLELNYRILNSDKFRTFLTAGASNLIFNNFTTNDAGFALNFGLSFQFFTSDFFGFLISAKDHFTFDLYGQEKTNNLSLNGGIFWNIY